MKGKRTLIIIIILIAVLLLIKFLFIPSTRQDVKAGGASQSAAVPVSGIVVKHSTITEQIYATGTVLANEEVALHPEVSGKLMQINFKEGSVVKKGDLLIKINDADLQAQLHKNALD